MLTSIIPLFPYSIDTFVDLFGGGFNMGINIDANVIIYNDKLSQVVELLKYMSVSDTKLMLHEIDYYIKSFALSKKNKAGYLTSPLPCKFSIVATFQITKKDNHKDCPFSFYL